VEKHEIVIETGEARWRAVREEVRRLGSPAERERSGRFLVEGLRLHERAVRAGAAIHTVLISESAARDDDPRWQALRSGLAQAGTAVTAAPDRVLAELVGGRKTGPVLGIVARSEPASLADLPSSRPGRPPLLLVADNVEDPGNVGAMIRTALAAGAAGFAAVGISDPYHPRAVRTSMGSLFRIPVKMFQAASEAVAACREAGLVTLGAVSDGGERPDRVRSALQDRGAAVFMGSEAFGLDAGTLDRLDRKVTIPMVSEIDSYSVNAAAAILLYALTEGRNAAAGPGGDTGVAPGPLDMPEGTDE